MLSFCLRIGVSLYDPSSVNEASSGIWFFMLVVDLFSENIVLAHMISRALDFLCIPLIKGCVLLL